QQHAVHADTDAPRPLLVVQPQRAIGKAAASDAPIIGLCTLGVRGQQERLWLGWAQRRRSLIQLRLLFMHSVKLPAPGQGKTRSNPQSQQPQQPPLSTAKMR